MNLHGLRKDRSLSMKELADIMHVSAQTIMNWENDIFEPSIDHLIKLADFFNVSIDYLVGRYLNQSDEIISSDKIKNLNKDEIIGLLKKILDLIHQE